MSDLDIIRKLEKVIRKRLPNVEYDNISVGFGYSISDQNQIIGLNLDEYSLIEIPDEICQLNMLRSLSLSSTKISCLPPDFANLTKLETLSLSSNALSSFPQEIVNLRSLKTLILSSNALCNLPPEIGQLTSLQRLFLSSNQLSSLPPEIEQLKSLQRLFLSSNQLSSLPPEIGQLTSLQTLYLDSNQLSSLPPEIGQLKSLNWLNLDSNQLSSLPPEIVQLKSLQTLDLSSNQLSSLPTEIVQLKSLQTLYLSSNQLSSLPPEIVQLKSLQRLFLSSNQLSSLPPEIVQLKSLQSLDLSSNQLSSLPPEIGQLTSLHVLYLDSNQLSSLPPEIGQLGLEVKWKDDFKGGIILENNPLESPPIDIVKEGLEAVKNYFKSLKGEKRPLNEVKLLFVGEGAAGKTSLMKRIIGEKFDPDEDQTDGITIKPWPFTENGTDIRANMWDFGGQHIMHATHQFFLSKRSLYVLLLDTRQDPKAEYWLKHIESFGGDSPILVVLNKIDENPGFRVNDQFLKSKYPNIKRFYRLSCANGQGLDDFVKDLRNYLSRVELINTVWGEKWFNVKSELERMRERKQDFISHGEYKELCKTNSITEQGARKTLVKFLHDLGVVVHFDDFDLGEVHVIDPKWITDGVYRIINSVRLAECFGILKLNNLDEILKKQTDDDYDYPRDKYRYLVKLMKKFELCYDIDDETILIPDLLDVQEPKDEEIDFNFGDCLRFRIDYDFLPKSVIARFIVKMHKDVMKKDGKPIHWRTGVILHDEAFKCTAVVKADEEERRIEIFINGEQKRDYLSVILFAFRSIHSSFEKLNVDEQICMPDQPDITASLEDLLWVEQEGDETILIAKAKRRYNVKELLGMVVPEQQTDQEILRILQKLVKDDDTRESAVTRISDVVKWKPKLFGAEVDVDKLMEYFVEKINKMIDPRLDRE